MSVRPQKNNGGGQKEEIKRAFPKHTYRDLEFKTQTDVVNCGIWAVWVGWAWIDMNKTPGVGLQEAMEELRVNGAKAKNLNNAHTADDIAGNRRVAENMRRHLRVQLDESHPDTDASLHQHLKAEREISVWA